MDVKAKIAEINEQAASIDSLTAEQCEALKGSIKDVAKALDKDDATVDEVAALNSLADTLDAVNGRAQAIADEIAQAQETRKAASERINRVFNSDEDATGGDNADGGDTNDDADKGGDADGGTPLDVKESVVAGANRPSPMMGQRKNVPAKGTSVQHVFDSDVALVAVGTQPGFTRDGEPFASPADLARAMSRRLASHTPKEGVIVASASWADRYPEERRLRQGAADNYEKMDAVFKARMRGENITAAGGASLPGNVDYSLLTFSTADRAFGSDVDQFQSDRGSLTFRQPPALSALADSTSVWTEATDADPGEATKNVYTVTIPSPETVYVNAIPTRLQFGNFTGQFDPELIQANTDLSMATAARVAEIELLTLLNAAASPQNVELASVLGASRDFVQAVELMAKTYRYVNRIPKTAMLKIVLPEWFKAALNIDRLFEVAHDAAGYDVFALDDGYWDDVLARRGVKVVWTYDAIPSITESIGESEVTLPTQQLVNPTANADFAPLPENVIGVLYADGMVQRLDGGQLNLGVVRDSVLDAQNNYQTFVEIFEGLAFRGFANGLWQFNLPINLWGGSGATIPLD